MIMRNLFVVCGLAVLSATAVPVVAQDFEWRGRIARGDEIEIKGVNGSVFAEFAPGNEVVVTAEKQGRRYDPDEVEIEVVEGPNGVTICAVYPSRRGRRNECRPGSRGRMNVRNNDTRVTFTVRVPAGVRFVARTVNGDVEAIDLQSEVEAYTVNGDIEVSTTEHAVATTVNGSIGASIGAGWNAALEFETVNGSIVLDLPADIDADLEVSTVNGSIDTAFPITVTGRLSRRRLRGRIGDGGPLLSVRTVNGSIQLRRSR